MAENKDYNVIDSAVLEIGFKINESNLIDKVSNAIKKAQDYADKNPININMQGPGGGKQSKTPLRMTDKEDGFPLYFDVGGLEKETLKEIMEMFQETEQQRGMKQVEARQVTRQKQADRLKFDEKRLALDREKFEYRKKHGEKGSIGDIGSAKGIAKLLGGSAGVAALAATTAIGMIVKQTVDEVIKRSTEISNKFITGNTAFVDRQTRGTMARFGLDPIAAQGLDKSMGLMGMSPEDFTLMTPGQQKGMANLMQTWFDGINNIGTDELQAFSDMTQEFQMNIAELKMQWELTKMEIMVTNRANIQSMQESISSLLQTIIDFAGNPVVQEGIGLFISFITGIVDGVDALISVLGRLLDVLSFLPGVGGSNTVNNTTNNVTNNEISIAGGLDFASGSMRN